MMAVPRALWKRCALARPQQRFAAVFDKGQLAFQDMDELVFVAVPVALAGPAAGRQRHEVDAKVPQPACVPSLLRVRSTPRSLKGSGYPLPLRTGMAERSILGMRYCGSRP